MHVPENTFKMKKASSIFFIIALSFLSGFAFSNLLSGQSNGQKKPRATGIGGIFFKCKDPAKLRDWYAVNLGLNTNKYGTVFEWWQGADSTQKGFTQWSPFSEKTKYFEPSTREFMINYRVENLNALLDQFKKNGVTIIDTVQTFDYGKFVHILDAEGNKLELWEPNDIEFEKLGKQINAKTTK